MTLLQNEATKGSSRHIDAVTEPQQELCLHPRSPVTIQLLTTSYHKWILLLHLRNPNPEVHGILNGHEPPQWNHRFRWDFVLYLGILRLPGQCISTLIPLAQNIGDPKLELGKKQRPLHLALVQHLGCP